MSFHPLSIINVCQNIFSVCFSHGIAYIQPESLTGRKWKTLSLSEAIAWYVKTFC